jgi:uncharacterized membrane protein
MLLAFDGEDVTMTKIEGAVIVAALGSGLMGGVFYGFSTFIMGALQALAPSAGITAMQSINVVVKNVWFLGVLLGMAPLCLWLGFASWSSAEPSSRLRVLAAFVYLVGCIGVTIACNVPRNDALSSVDAHSAEGAALWASFVPSWTLWNHVRCASCCVASVLFMISLLELPMLKAARDG